MSATVLEPRTLGPAGLVVPELGLGCMGMSDAYGPVAREDAIATIHEALDLGVRLLDTADAYGRGHNEELVGQAVADRRGEAVVATKFGIEVGADGSRRINGHPDYVRGCAVASLRRLRVDCIDVYYQHRVDPTVPIEDTVGAMSELVAEGKVRYLGLSQASAESLRRACVVHPISALQAEWSIWTRELEGEVLDTARQLGIGIVAYCPLGRGFLSGSVTSRALLSKGDARWALPRFQTGALEHNLATLAAIERLAASKGVTTAQLALAWVLSRGDDVVPIPGTKRVRYLRENLAAARVELTDEELRSIKAAAAVGGWEGARSSAKLSSGFGNSPLPTGR